MLHFMGYGEGVEGGGASSFFLEWYQGMLHLFLTYISCTTDFCFVQNYQGGVGGGGGGGCDGPE